MKKIGKFLAVAFIFASTSNLSIAAESASKEVNMGFADILPFILGILLIFGVLYLGYKMDRASEGGPAPKQKSKKKAAKDSFAEEIQNDIPYEAEANDYFEADKDFSDFKDLNEEKEYDDEDDVSLFSAENDEKPTFNDIDDSISYDVEEPAKTSNFGETMVFDSDELKDSEPEVEEPEAPAMSEDLLDKKLEELDALDDLDDKNTSSNSAAAEEAAKRLGFFGVQENAAPLDEVPVEDSEDEEDDEDDEIVEEEPSMFDSVEEPEETEEPEYSEPVELDSEIDALDDLDNLDVKSTSNKSEEANSFFNEINRYKEEAENNFSGFTTEAPKEEIEEPEIEIPDVEEPKVEVPQEHHVKRYTKKVTRQPIGSIKPAEPSAPSAQEDTFVEEPSGQMDFGFLNQMEQTLKRSQEERNKGVAQEAKPETKRRGRKPTNED